MARRLAFAAILALTTLAMPAQADFNASPVGTWKTIDDDTGQAKAIVKITESGGKISGRIVKLFANPSATCSECNGNNKDKPIVGMRIVWGLEADDDEWSGGKILDPKNGKVYRAKMWLDGSNLKVRGYLGPFYRTQTWRPG